jgi:hypothetical protein
LIGINHFIALAWLSCGAVIAATCFRMMMNQKLETVGDDRKVKDSLVCEHPRTESLGFNSNVRFSRCQQCGYVLVREGQRTWAVPPVERTP